MFDSKGRFVMENYAVNSTFASFLPGISGEMGIPIWCFYVNRGQAVCSFGVSDKEHSIMEFYPAHQSYQNVSTTGFRTFLKVDGVYYEPFRQDAMPKKMYIGMNELEIEEENAELGIRTKVLYYTLPEEAVGALCRIVTVENMGEAERQIEILDGMPAVLTYGTSQGIMKSMAQTHKAWMQVEDVESRMPYYRVGASTGDVAEVTEVKEGNFYLGMEADGTLLPVIVDPEVVFEYDVAMTEAVGFRHQSLAELYARDQVTKNNVPTGFFGKSVTLAAGASISIYEVIGEVASKAILQEFAAKCTGAVYFEEKHARAEGLTRDLCQVIHTESADPVFDAYSEQTYLDNVLRGGYPVVLGDPEGKHQIYYVYSRKHGDIERDYNFFRMLPEFYSQGNANFRDVNQNRRSDNLFTPYVKDVNIRTFYNLIQLDGNNPLAVEMASFTIRPEGIPEVLALVEERAHEPLKKLFEKPYTPGLLTGYLYNEKIEVKGSIRDVLNKAAEYSDSDLNANFGEGYWTDHWTYNLDLVESFLAVYPDEEEQLLFGERDYTYFESKAVVNPRSLRYQMRPQGVRQYNAVDHEKKAEVTHQRARTRYGKGEIYRSNLAEKMLMLLLSRYAALDPYGMGVEMEAGKPGWYDALNGMPGIFGSSMAETYEVSRLTAFLAEELTKYPKSIKLPVESYDFLCEVNHCLEQYRKGELDLFGYWDQVNNKKEAYRERICYGVDGAEKEIPAEELLATLQQWQQMLKEGIDRAVEYGGGISPCYFSYELDQYEEKDGVILPKHFTPVIMPYFLEGPVRYLKLKDTSVSHKEMYDRVRSSEMYDKELKMYKVNAPLTAFSHEVGRARAFTPGWLENESIWLHMEYKYLLELLKSGLYREYFADLKDAAVPFLDEKKYGRSPLENSSFIASSANPNPRFRGKGFVARLSGSTAEFVNMWQIMMFGQKPFAMEEGELVFRPEPALPDYLIREDGSLVCTLLGAIPVTYRAGSKCSLIPGEYEITEIDVTRADGSQEKIAGSCLRGELAEAVRGGAVAKLEIVVDTK